MMIPRDARAAGSCYPLETSSRISDTFGWRFIAW